MRDTHSQFRSTPCAPAAPRTLVARAIACALLGLLLAVGATAAQGTVYHGNVQSHIFHQPGCTYYTCKACTAVFTTRQAAVEAGFRPCKVCRP